MVGYLQSQDVFVRRLRMGPEETLLADASESETKQLPLIGSFSFINGRRILLYRWDGELNLRVGDAAPIRLRNTKARWRWRRGEVTFTLTLGSEQIVREVYPLSRDTLRIGDPTPFIEPEDFDFFLFVRNVLHDPERAERIYQDS